MVYIPGGYFIMGSEKGPDDEKPLHLLRVDGFYMGQYPVTQEEWQSVMGNNPSTFKGARRPVENVSWLDCQKYLKKLSQNHGAVQQFSLPTETEWEYACRADTRTEYFFGDNDGLLSRYAVVDKKSTQPVGQKLPNPWQLYDMLGNVWEWCSSRYQSYPYDAEDGRENLQAEGPRVVRGGAFDVSRRGVRCAFRDGYDPGSGDDFMGFRVVARPFFVISEASHL